MEHARSSLCVRKSALLFATVYAVQSLAQSPRLNCWGSVESEAPDYATRRNTLPPHYEQTQSLRAHRENMKSPVVNVVDGL